MTPDLTYFLTIPVVGLIWIFFVPENNAELIRKIAIASISLPFLFAVYVYLMYDQTTGGYPRLVKVAEVDLPACAQLKPGHCIHFEVITLQEAEKLYLDLQSDFKKLVIALQLKIIS